MSDAERQILADIVADAHIEVMPVEGIAEQLKCLSSGTTVTVTCSPRKGIDATLDTAALLAQQGFKVVPHIAARQISDKNHLKRILAQLSGSGINSIFVPGGDVSSPIGEFNSALQLLRAMSELDHGIDRIGVAAYPEGHPFIDDDTLIELLIQKQEFATSCVTQMCFCGQTITDWIRNVRDKCVKLPIRVGIPGAVERKKLFTFSLRIGVGESARFSLKQPKVVRKLMAAKIYEPDDLILHLANYVESSRFNISGLHLYTFNQVEATQRWRSDFLDT
jgi:methylenetetrahydrofolate reductase (NADPH)